MKKVPAVVRISQGGSDAIVVLYEYGDNHGIEYYRYMPLKVAVEYASSEPMYDTCRLLAETMEYEQNYIFPNAFYTQIKETLYRW